MIATFKLHVYQQVVCDICEAIHVLGHFILRPGERMPDPQVPDNWTVVDDKIYCERHVVNVSTPTMPGA